MDLSLIVDGHKTNRSTKPHSCDGGVGSEASSASNSTVVGNMASDKSATYQYRDFNEASTWRRHNSPGSYASPASPESPGSFEASDDASSAKSLVMDSPPVFDSPFEHVGPPTPTLALSPKLNVIPREPAVVIPTSPVHVPNGFSIYQPVDEYHNMGYPRPNDYYDAVHHNVALIPVVEAPPMNVSVNPLYGVPAPAGPMIAPFQPLCSPYVSENLGYNAPLQPYALNVSTEHPMDAQLPSPNVPPQLLVNEQVNHGMTDRGDETHLPSLPAPGPSSSSTAPDPATVSTAPAETESPQVLRRHVNGNNLLTAQMLQEHILVVTPSPNQRIRTKTRKFVCQECGKSFFRKSDLVRHIQIHLNIKPNQCPMCGKRFIQRSALTVHKRTHTGEKPYRCEECGRYFSDSSSIARHRRVHQRERERERERLAALLNSGDSNGEAGSLSGEDPSNSGENTTSSSSEDTTSNLSEKPSSSRTKSRNPRGKSTKPSRKPVKSSRRRKS